MTPNVFGSGLKSKANVRTGKLPPPKIEMPVESKPAPSATLLGSRRFSLEISLSGFMTAGIFLLIAIGFIFAFGLMVGRGYNPEEQIPQIAQFLPELNPEQPSQDAKILRPEDLEFMTELKQDDAMGLPDEEGTNSKEGTDQESIKQSGIDQSDVEEALVLQKAAVHIKPSKALMPEGETVKVILADTSKSGLSETASSSMYDFVFQVVAYKTSARAETLRERLEEDGLRTRMRVGKTGTSDTNWYRVQVLLRGTEARAITIREGFARFGISDAVIVSKERVRR